MGEGSLEFAGHRLFYVCRQDNDWIFIAILTVNSFILPHLLLPELAIYFSCLVMAEFRGGETCFLPDDLCSGKMLTKGALIVAFFYSGNSSLEHLLLLHQILEILWNFYYPNVSLLYVSETEGKNDPLFLIASHFLVRLSFPCCKV